MTATQPGIITQFDTLDDRREIWHLLHRLPPKKRYQFLCWACSKVQSQEMPPEPNFLDYSPWIKKAKKCDEADFRLTNLIYLDLGVLGCQYRLNMDETTRILERIVRGEL